MSEPSRTFSESWYRIADQRLCLRPQVKVRRQHFRGEKWFVLHDPFNNQFFRLRPASYEFVARLRLDRTVEEVWKECIEQDPDEAPGQEDVIQLLAQLYHANLLHYRLAGDTGKLFERFKKRRQQEIQSKLLNVMFARFPLWDPDDFLKRAMPVIDRLFGRVGALLWLCVVALAGKVVVENASALWEQAQGVLAPENLFLLYLAFAVSKGLHELSHAAVCRRYGGEVHVMGIMLLIFTPIPYMDATASWAFRSRWKRILVGAAGMIVEIFVAACAALLWAGTGPGVVHSLAYNVMFTASVSTILFNANPLLRYDGYYILSDLLDIPNLYPRSLQQITHWAERYGFGFKRSKNPTRSTKEAIWLTVYGLASNVYRIVVFGGIIIFVTKRLLLLGIIMAFVCVISWVLYPIGKFIYYLATSPKLDRTRPRAIAVSACVAGTILVFLGLVPFPHHFRAPGILQSQQYAIVANMEPGYIEEILSPAGTQVVAGQPLVRLKSQELEIEARLAHAQRRQAMVLWRQALQSGSRELEPIRRHLEAVEQRMEHLKQRQELLTVRADRSGKWVAPELKDRLGAWVGRGRPLGEIVNDEKFDFTLTVSQEDASSLFSEEIRGAEIRILGEADRVVRTEDWRVIPVQRQNLPSPALGYGGGGNVAVDMSDKSGTRAAEPFFEVRASLPSGQATTFLHGRSGKIRFDLQPAPLLSQWIRRLRQLIQKRSYA